MPYDFYMDGVRLPVTPPKLSLKVNNQNRTLNLINEGEVNVLKKQALTDIAFSALLPAMRGYTFAVYETGFRPPEEFLDWFETLKNRTDRDGRLLPFTFIVSRTTPSGGLLFSTSLEVALQSYSVDEEAGRGFDVTVDIVLKQYKTYGTKTVKISNNATEPTVTVEEERPATNAPQNATHTVQEGEALYHVAQLELGYCGRWEEIYEANKDMIDSRNIREEALRYTIHPGQELRIPDGGAL